MGLIFQRAKTGFLNPVNSTVDKLISASNGLMCLKSTIFGGAPNLSSIMLGLAGVAAGLISAIVSSVTDVILKRVDQIIRSVLSPIRQIEQIITDITKVLISTQAILDKALNMNSYFQDKQNCAVSSAQLMNCLAQAAINKISTKIAMNVDKQIAPIANSISRDAFKVNGSISQYVDRNTKFIAKAQLQTKLLT